jgi:Fis family transcriptional regulator
MKKKAPAQEGELARCVRRSMNRYFKDLDGSKATDVYAMVLSEVEKPLLEVVMNSANSNQCQAAEILGINRNTLRKKLKQYKIIK